MLDSLVEDGILLLLKLPIGDVGGGQSSWPCLHSHPLAGSLVVRVRPHSLFSPFVQGHDGVVQGSPDPWVWDRGKVDPNFTWREGVVQTTQEVSHSVVFTLLVLEGKVVTGQLGYPPLAGSIQIG